jgi:transcriptional regulator with XRE-family HTH domain
MSKFEQWVEQYREDPEYQFEMASLAFGECVVSRMEALGLRRSDLAARMGVSKPRVTQILAGDENLTLKTMVAMANALEMAVSLSLKPRPAREQREPISTEELART